METITLRQARPEDAEAVLEIYAPYIKNTRRLLNRQTHRFYWVFLHLLYKFSLRRWYNSSYHTNYPLPTEEKIYAY